MSMERGDRALVVFFAVFAFTSLVMEPYFVFGVDYHRPHDPFALGWLWYAERFDPIFLRRPLWLRAFCLVDFAVNGPFYLVAIFALVKRREVIRPLARVVFAGLAITTSIYFAVELATEHDANLPMVILINIPYLIVAIAAFRRFGRPLQGALNADREVVAA